MKYSLAEIFETVFPECKKAIRIIMVFLEHEGDALTRYSIEKKAAVNRSSRIIERLLKLGIIKEVNENPRAYILNVNNPFVEILKELFCQEKFNT